MQRTQLRIVAGSLKGRKISCAVHPGMRPTPQAVREALFSILGGNLVGRHFIDIFAGTGVVGLEAISRGAQSVTFVERDVRQANAIQQHLKRFEIAPTQAHILRADVYRWGETWIPPSGEAILFLSPPFRDFKDQMPAFARLIKQLRETMAEGSVMVVQGEEGFPQEELPEAASWDLRKYGRNLLLVANKEPTGSDDGT